MRGNAVKEMFFRTEGAFVYLAQGKVLRVLRATLSPWVSDENRKNADPREHGGDTAAMLAGIGFTVVRFGTQGIVNVRKPHADSPWARQIAGPLARRTENLASCGTKILNGVAPHPNRLPQIAGDDACTDWAQTTPAIWGRGGKICVDTNARGRADCGDHDNLS